MKLGNTRSNGGSSNGDHMFQILYSNLIFAFRGLLLVVRSYTLLHSSYCLVESTALYYTPPRCRGTTKHQLRAIGKWAACPLTFYVLLTPLPSLTPPPISAVKVVQ